MYRGTHNIIKLYLVLFAYSCIYADKKDHTLYQWLQIHHFRIQLCNYYKIGLFVDIAQIDLNSVGAVKSCGYFSGQHYKASVSEIKNEIIMQQDLNDTTICILTEYNASRSQSVLDVLNWRYALPAGNPAIFKILKVSLPPFAIVCFCSNVKWCELYVSIYGIYLYVAVVFWHSQIKYQIKCVKKVA